MSTSEFDLKRLWDSLPGPGQQAAEGDDKLRSLWDSLPEPKPESTVGRQFARGFAEAGLATGAGLAKLLPDRFLSEDSRLRNENIEAMHQGARERLAGWAGEADTGLEKAAGVVGRLAGEAALFVGSGMGAGAVARGAARALPAASRAGRFAQAVARPTTMGQRVARDFVAGAPVDAAIASAGAEESTIGGIAELTDSERLRRVAENPAARIASDVAIGGALGAAVEGGIAGVRAARRALDAGDAVEAGLRDVAPEDLAPTRDVFSPYDEQPPMPPPEPTPPPSYPWVPVEPMSQRAVALDRARRIAAETEQVPAPQPRYPIIETAEAPPRYPIIEPPPPRQGAPEAPAEVRVERAPGVVPLTEARPVSDAPTAGGRRVRTKQHVRTKPEYTASPQPGTRIERPVVIGGRGTPSEPPPASPQPETRIERPVVIGGRGMPLESPPGSPQPGTRIELPVVIGGRGTRRSVDALGLERRGRPPVQGPEAPEVTTESTARLRAPQDEPTAPSTAREAVREPEAPEVREAPASTAVDEDAPVSEAARERVREATPEYRPGDPARETPTYWKARGAAQKMDDDKLRRRYMQALRTQMEWRAIAEQTEGKQVRRKWEHDLAIGGVGTGVGRNQRGTRTRAEAYEIAYAEEMLARGHKLPTLEEAVTEATPDEVPYALRDEFVELRDLDDAAVLERWGVAEEVAYNEPGNWQAQWRRAMYAGEAQRRGLEVDPDPEISRPLAEEAEWRAPWEDEFGGASSAVVGALARTGTGAVAGGIADTAVGEDQSPIEGMIAGAALAAGAPAAVRAVRGRGASEAAEAATEAVTGPVITDEVLQAEIRRAQADLRRPAPTPTPPGVEIDPDEFVNVSKFALSPESEALLREQVTEVVREQGLAPKKSVSWEETRKIADRVAKEIGLDPDQLDDAKLKRGRLNGPEMLAIRGVVSANVDQIETLSRQIETGLKADGTPLSAEELDALAMRMARLEEDNGKLLDAFIRSRTQTGRDLNNLKILANRTLDPATWLAKAQRTAGAPLPAAVQAEIRKLIQKGDREGLIAYVAGLRKAGAGEKLTTLWKAGLLTGPPTHVANLLGNLAMATLETAKDVPAYYFDRMVSTLTGVQTKYRPSARTIGARLEGAKEGAGKAAEIFGVKDALAALKAGDGAKEATRRLVERIRRHDLTESDIRKLDFGRFVNFDNAFADVYTKGVFKALAAGDRVFKTAALFGSLDEQARLIAKAEGLKGEAFEARVRELINRPTDEMSLRAIADAEIATFQNRGALSKLIGSAKQSLRTSNPAVHTVIETVFPFVTTPANIATRVVEYSPLGALRSLHDLQRLARKVVDEAEIPAVQKQAVETLGRAVTGSGTAIALGYYLASKDLMTGAYPSEQRQRNAWELEGKQEYSVKIGDKWWSLERISPLGQLLIVGAQMHDFLADPRPMQEKLSEYTAQGSKMLVEMTPLQGFESFMELLSEGRSAFIESLAGSIVPAAVGRVARVGDPYVRVSEGPIERIQSRIPIARQQLPTKINVLGEDVQANPGVASNILDPFNARQASDDPLVLEMERVGAGLPTLAKRPQESEEAYRERQRLYGQVARLVLESVIQSPEYQQWPELARWIVENVPEAAGTDPDEWAKMQQRELLEDAITQARRKLSQQLSGQ